MNIPFSQRYGYVKPADVIVREELSGAILNTVMNSFTELYNKYGFSNDELYQMNSDFARYYLNLRFEEINKNCFYYRAFIDNEVYEWYKRLDSIEWIIAYHRQQVNCCKYKSQKDNDEIALNTFIGDLNKEFDRLNYAYRIINDVFIETTSVSELATIDEALSSVDCEVVAHLSECLKLMSPSNPSLSTRNAIKEAISAVEVVGRKITKTNTLDDAFKKFNTLHPQIRSSMKALYQYTNQPNTGIRHAWMEQIEEPTMDEAIFVLVTGCAFINYLRKIYK
jgi:hypothetical protein